MSNFFYPLAAYAKGFWLMVSRPKFLILSIVPIILNLVLAILVIYFASDFGFDWIENWLSVQDGQTWLGFLAGILKTALVLISIVVGYYLLIILGLAIASPFAGIISEDLLEENGVKILKNYSGISLILFEISRSLKFEVQKLLISGLILIPALFLNLIPVIGNAIFVGIAFGLTGYLTTLDLLDPAFARLDYSFKEKRKELNSNLKTYFLLILANGFLMAIPLLNIFLVPVCAIASTLCFVKTRG